jgi:hypothetical protein
MPSLNSEPAQAQVPDLDTVTTNPNQALSAPDPTNTIASQLLNSIPPLLETPTSTEPIPAVTIDSNRAPSTPDAANTIASQSPSRPGLDATDLDQILAHLEDHLAFELSRTYGVSGE